MPRRELSSLVAYTVMDRPHGTSEHPRLLALAAVVIVVAALYFARDLLIPVLLAALAGFVLSPIATVLARRIGRVASVVAVVVLACGPGQAPHRGLRTSERQAAPACRGQPELVREYPTT